MDILTYVPTQEQFDVVINTLKRANEIAIRATGEDAMVDMNAIMANSNCKTPMCHGGWYGIMISNSTLSYHAGSHKLAQDLGFTDDFDLREWAFHNHIIWGNIYGRYMFGKSIAFGLTKVTTLDEIISHWQGVKERASKK